MLALDLLDKIVPFKSVTPLDGGVLDYIQLFLEKRSFKVIRKELRGAFCLYARKGDKGKNFCFSGHVDVVPPGDLSFWKTDPFKMVQQGDKLFGRGVCDMKGGIAAFLHALDDLLKNEPALVEKNSISVMLTSDEEKAGITSCKDFMKDLNNAGEKIDYCLIGEPTCYDKFGDSIKIGRRGSVTINLKVIGLGGHVAYPQFTNNPNRVLIKLLESIQSHTWDKGTKDFEPSNLEVVGMSSSENVSNMVPNYASAMLNIRFNVLQNSEDIESFIRNLCNNIVKNPYKLEISFTSGNKPFVSKDRFLFNTVKKAIQENIGIDAYSSTGGGASDGSYISQYCNDIVEFGVMNRTAHKANESIYLYELENLTKIYYSTLLNIFR